jgi:hypothetical protein
MQTQRDPDYTPGDLCRFTGRSLMWHWGAAGKWFGDLAPAGARKRTAGSRMSGKYCWTDVFVCRSGRWQAASSQSTKLTAPEGLKFAKLHDPR